MTVKKPFSRTTTFQNDNVSTKQPHWKYTWFATFLVIMASLIFTASNFVVKSEALNSEEVLLVRSVLQTGIHFAIAVIRGHSMWPTEAGDNLNKVRCSLLFSGLAGNV